MMNLLDPLRVGLKGSTLIEASAGTGKTYTITTLFLRLLLEQKVSIDKVLVVTFTIAATEELRIKLSSRLHLAYRWLRYPDTIEEADDPTLAELIKTANPQQALILVGDAVARLDDLSVYTIDAMCLRILQDFAFESCMPMRIDMIADDSEIRNQVARDYWRQVLGSGDDFRIDNMLSLARSPEALLNKLNDVLRRREAELLPDYDSAQVVQLATEVKRQYRQIYECWKNHSRRIQEVFADELGVLNKRSYSEDAKNKAINWLKSLDERLPTVLSDKFSLITASTIELRTKKNQPVPRHQFFDLCDGFEEQFNEYTKLRKIAAVHDARNHLVDAIDQYKADRSVIHFEDMRTRLDTALQSKDGAQLAEKIRLLWPFALIDEFQDTDAEQFRIFSTVYANQPQCGFFMIGDPKQAVYSWRGADVFTYMSAGRQTPNAFTLGTNWRSSPSMVNAVNCVFASREDPFIFDQIPFNPVQSSESNSNLDLIRDGIKVAPLGFRIFESAASRDIAMACASEIARLLVDGRSGGAVIDGVGVSPADVAILVRSHAEAALMQSELRRFGVRSVSMPNSTVFQTAEAAELYQVLHAMAYPGREGELRAALVTNLLGYNSRDMELMLLDESRWDRLIDSFIGARELWLDHGFMFALQVLLEDLGVADRMLQSVDGEQRMTNLMQLAELLQIKAREIASHEELILWLKDQIDNSLPGEDALLLRLESDEGLVQIVTMHKSKGLEYPVVFIPFPASLNTSGSKSNDIVVYHDREDFRVNIDLGSDNLANAQQLRLQESLSEELRLLYVAMTRSRSACVLYWGVSKGIGSSALKYLLYPDVDKMTADIIRPGLSQLELRADGSIEVTSMERDDTVLFTDTGQNTSLTLLPFTAAINRRWGMSSYTGLLRGKDEDMPDHDEMSEPADEVMVEADVAVNTEEQEISSLPAGARTGQLLHEIFEFMDFTDTSNLDELIGNSMLRHGNLSSSSGDSDWSVVIKKIIHNTLAAHLDANSGFCLKDISSKDRLNEMEFFFAVSDLSPKSLQNALTAFPQYQAAANGLKFPAFEGLMQGFIDMVVRKDNQYFIVDYKSNWLGDSLDSYSQVSIKASVDSHRYNLQYLIYTVALHRYLTRRVTDYNYESHFGGVYYLFIRGMRSESSSGVWFDKPPFALIDALDKKMQKQLVA